MEMAVTIMKNLNDLKILWIHFHQWTKSNFGISALTKFAQMVSCQSWRNISNSSKVISLGLICISEIFYSFQPRKSVFRGCSKTMMNTDFAVFSKFKLKCCILMQGLPALYPPTHINQAELICWAELVSVGPHQPRITLLHSTCWEQETTGTCCCQTQTDIPTITMAQT